MKLRTLAGALALAIVPSAFAQAPTIGKLCTNCHQAAPGQLQGIYENVAFKSKAIQLKIDATTEVVRFDPATLKVVDAGVAKPAEALKELPKNKEARIEFAERDGVKVATLISFKGPIKIAPEKLVKYEEVARLVAMGVRIVDPRQTFIDGDVDPGRIDPTAILHPGTRLSGARTFVGPGAVVGREGPAALVNAVLGEGAVVASGYVEEAVLLRGARLGADAHVREGTLLEEEASTAHAVRLKHTVLLAFVTLGSLVNFCDVLMAGGTSRQDHSEVGSGFIHFNFTPWGRAGDKATPSLLGDVVRGVFLDQPRIFLGGAGGMVGPRVVGYGSVVGAGQVLRRDVPEGRLVVAPPPEVDQPALRALG